jgi:hypothetical protein
MISTQSQMGEAFAMLNASLYVFKGSCRRYEYICHNKGSKQA